MSKQERSPQREHAAIKEVVLDPASLVADNLAANIIDTGHYSNFYGANFNPARYVKTEVLRVNYPDSPEGFRYRLKDGHHRTKGAMEYRDKIDPDYVYVANDVTDDVISKDSTLRGQTTLTVSQYLVEVINPTKAHREIASPRMAAHFMAEWKSMVGDAVAEGYSALSALSFLSDRQIRNQPDDRIERYFREMREQQQPLMAHETPEKRDALEKGLQDMAGVIRDTKLGHADIQQAAFRIVTSQDEDIDGSAYAAQQIRGLVYHPEIDAKLHTTFRGPLVEQRRDELGSLIVAAFTKAGAQEDVQSLSELVVDPHVNYEDLTEVLMIPGPTEPVQTITERYNAVKKRINRNKISAHIKAGRDTDLNDLEYELIDHLSGTKVIDLREVQSAGGAVTEGEYAIGEANILLDALRDPDIRQSVEARRDAVLTATTPHQMRLRTNALIKVVGEHRAASIDKTTSDLIRRTITGIFPPQHLAGPTGVVIKDHITHLVMKHAKSADPEEIIRSVVSIYNLGEDMFAKVISGAMSLDSALQQGHEHPEDTIWTSREALPDAIDPGQVIFLADLQAITDPILLAKVQKGDMTVYEALAEQPWREASTRQRAHEQSESTKSRRSGRRTRRSGDEETEKLSNEIILLKGQISALETERDKLVEENTLLRLRLMDVPRETRRKGENDTPDIN
jgi:hypothetical protein